MLQGLADIGDQPLEGVGSAVQRRQIQRGLVGVTDRLAHGREQQRAAGDGLQASFGMRSTAVPAPPVVDQRTRPRHRLAAVDVLRSEAAQTPLVLQLVKGVLRIGPVTVELPDRLQRVSHVGDQHRVLLQPLTLVHARSCQVQPQLLAVHAPLPCDASSDALAHDDDPPLGAPAVQLQLGLHHLAALTVWSAPVLAGELLGHQALHVLCLAQSQQVGLLALFQRQQDAFVAVAGVTAHQRRASVAEFVEQSAQRPLGVSAAVLLSRAELHIEHQAQVADQEGVQHVARTRGLGGASAPI